MSLTPGFYGKQSVSEDDAIALIKKALDLGVNVFNTSDLYGPYTNEVLLGACRSAVQTSRLATCVGLLNTSSSSSSSRSSSSSSQTALRTGHSFLQCAGQCFSYSAL